MELLVTGPWGTLASAFFFLAAVLGGDVLVLRGCLCIAYVFLLINGVTGVPSWPAAAAPGRVNIDMVAWSIAAGSLHGLAVLRMLCDELPVRFSSDDDAQLARFLNRRSGMEPLEAKEVLRRGRWVRVPGGQRVLAPWQLYEGLYLMVEGVASYSTPCCPATPEPSVHRGCEHASPPAWPAGRADESSSEGDSADEARPALARPSLLLASQAELASKDGPPGSRLGPWLSPRSRQGSSSAAGAAPDVEAGHAGLPPVCAGGQHAPAPPPPLPQQQQQQQQRQQPQPNTLQRSLNRQRLMRSGHLFSIGALNVLGVYVGFDQCHGSQLEVVAETDCLLFCWSLPELNELACDCSPTVAAYCRNLALFSVASQFEHRVRRGAPVRCSTGALEPDAWLQGGRSRDFTDPQRPYEQQRCSWARFLRWARHAVGPLPPHAIRHTALPLTGVQARTRVMAMRDARRQAALSRDLSLRAGVAGTPSAGAPTVEHRLPEFTQH